MEKRFCFLRYFPLSFFIPFLVQQSFQLFSKVCIRFWLFLSAALCHTWIYYDNSEQVFSPLQTQLVFLFLKFLMRFRFRLGSCFWCYHGCQKEMPYWRNFQSLLILLINFIQFRELIFVNKFRLINIRFPVYLFRIYCTFYSIFFPLLLSSITIKLYQLHFDNKCVSWK